MKQTASASPVNRCPACRDGATVQRETYGYARVYLCGAHRAQWDAADDAAHGKAGCPWRPADCIRRGCEKLSATA